MARRLGNLERQLLAYAQLRNLREIRTGDLTGPLSISSKQERELLSRDGKKWDDCAGSTWALPRPLSPTTGK